MLYSLYEQGSNPIMSATAQAASQSAHTPGPWVACDRVVVVTVEGHGYGTHIADCGVGGASGKEQLANARLVAAAPDMLAALQAAEYYIDRLEAVQQRRVVRDMTEAMEHWHHARAAIARAESRT